jgi:hypothetical protein
MNKRLAVCALALVVSISCGDSGGGASGDDAGNTMNPSPDAGGHGDGDVTPGDGDVTPGDGDVTPGDGDVTPGDGDGNTNTDAGTKPVAVPFYADDQFAPSGYMGDITGIKDTQCASAGPSGLRKYCHHIAWTPGGMGWGGVFWQFPDGNWGAAPGLRISKDAKEIVFFAWGDKGGEKVNFGAGYDMKDPAAPRTGDVTLTTTPTEYHVALPAAPAGKDYIEFKGGFVWITAGASAGFNIDGIRYVGADVVEPDAGTHDGGTVDMDGGTHDGGTHDAGSYDGGVAPTDAGHPGLAVPFYVDDQYTPSGYMTNGGGITDSACTVFGPSNESKYCHHFSWTPNAATWGGVFWQYPAGNWGGSPGLLISADAKEIVFWAWGDVGGEKVSFGAGYDTVTDPFNPRTGDLTLTTTPTEYHVALPALATAVQVKGGFVWVVGAAAQSFTIADIRYEGASVPSDAGAQDAGVAHDAGHPQTDAGHPAHDAGTVDAGHEHDAGAAHDAGSADDAGAVSDAGAGDAGTGVHSRPVVRSFWASVLHWLGLD